MSLIIDTVTNPLIFIIVKYFPGGKKENIKAFIKEEDARFAASQIISNTYTVGLEVVMLHGTYKNPK